MNRLVEFPDRRLLDEEAAEWLIRLDADASPCPEDLRELAEWLQRSPAHRDRLTRLATLWGRMNVLTELAVPLGRPVGQASVLSGGGGRAGRRIFGLPALVPAVSLAVIAVVGLLLMERWPLTDPLSGSMICGKSNRRIWPSSHSTSYECDAPSISKEVASINSEIVSIKWT